MTDLQPEREKDRLALGLRAMLLAADDMQPGVFNDIAIDDDAVAFAAVACVLTPTGQVLRALVDEATSYIASVPRRGSWDGLVAAAHRYLAATETAP
jgi:hypothetical protein